MTRHRSRSLLLSAALLIGAATIWVYFAPATIGGSTTYVITHGVSMEPRFHSGDLAIVRPTSRYTVGEVVAYHSSLLHLIVLHRIVAIHDGRYTFKGDNNHFLDPVHPRQASIVGRLWLHLGNGGNLLAYLHSPLVVFALLGGLGLLLLAGVGEQRRGRRTRRGAARTQPGRATSMSPDTASTPGRYNRQTLVTSVVTAGVASLIFLGATLFAFSRPAHRSVHRTTAYAQTAKFGYHALARSGPVYPDGVVTTGAPIFLQLVHSLEVDVEYHLNSASTPRVRGVGQLFLKLSGDTGWRRSIPLTGTRRFSGPGFGASAVLNLVSLQSMLSKVATETGVPTTGYTIDVVAAIHVRGRLASQAISTRFMPGLSFSLESLQLLPDGASASSGAPAGGAASSSTGSPASAGASGGFAPSQPGALVATASTGNSVRLVLVTVPVSVLRFFAPLGFLVALAAALLLATVLARSAVFGESARIQSKYGHMIVPIKAGDDLGWPAIDVGDIKALARLAECSGQLILHSHGVDTDTYLVNDEGSVYRYQVQMPKIVWSDWTEPAATAVG